VLAVRDWQPEEEPSVYFTWADPPVVFVAEIFSSSQPATHQGREEKEYETLVRAREYLSYDQDRGELRLRRLGPNGYEGVLPEPSGRVRSHELQLEFGEGQDGFLWANTLDGERLQTYEELDRRVMDEGERRAAAEARAAAESREREAAGEARQRAAAESRAVEAARLREEESRRRAEAEERARELERQLAALRAQLQERGG
jgi:hypothetical protein